MKENREQQYKRCPYENKACTDKCRYASTCIQRKEGKKADEIFKKI